MQNPRVLLFMVVTAGLFAAVAASAQTYTRLYTYPITNSNTSGITQTSVLSQGRDGELYSTIQTNGAYNAGSMYKINTVGQYMLLYSFCQEVGHCLVTGAYPTGGVNLGFDGNLWGTTNSGGKDNAGTVFKITPAGLWTKLYDFTNNADDSAPIYAPLQGQNGDMYGVSETQYVGQYGSFYRLTTQGKITPHPFNYSNGATPNLPVQGTDGNFYGTTQIGGDSVCRCGVIYKATAGGVITVLHKFTGYPNDGYIPVGVLVQGYDGNFYGQTYQGGANNQGTVFKISSSGTYTLLHSFLYRSPSFDGQLPTAGLTLGTDGNLYGTTGNGGKGNNAGTIFKITPNGAETVLYNFCLVSCVNGYYASTAMVLHTDGKFYGTTAGNSLGGSVFYSFDVGLPPFVKLVTWTGQVGATAEILGQGLMNTTAVSFGGVAANFTKVSDTYLTAAVPTGALTGQVAVTTSLTHLKSDRTFLVIPQVKSFSPTSGAVGTQVMVTGVSLTQTQSGTIGGKAASCTVNSDTQVTCTVPAGARTGLPISVTTAGGSASSTAKFAVVPQVLSFSPTNGPVGTHVTITGNSFTGATKVTFGGVASTTYQVVNDTNVTAVVPTGALTGPIAVTTPGGTGTSTANFTVTH